MADEVGDTDRYVATVAPLAGDPAIQDAIANRVGNAVQQNLDLGSLLQQVAPDDRPRTVVGAAGLTLALWPYPTGRVIAGLALALLAALTAVEFLADAPTRQPKRPPRALEGRPDLLSK